MITNGRENGAQVKIVSIRLSRIFELCSGLAHGGLPFFKKIALDLFARYDGIVYGAGISLLMVSAYLGAAIIDQGRILISSFICGECAE